MAAAPALSLNADAVRLSGFPVYSLHPAQRRAELKKLLEYDHANLIHTGFIGQTMHGLSLAWHYHPHAWSVRCGDMLTPLQVFGNHDLLHKALARRKKLGSCETDSDLRKAVRTYSGTQSVSNFRPTAAAAIYDRYLPHCGGSVWDMSAGFGGRLLGAFACQKVAKYIGTDPATLTMDGLSEMRDELVPTVQRLGHSVPQIELHQIGSEDFTPEPESLDVSFTSPPYGGHEEYSDEPTQSYIKFPTHELWLNGFMKQTLDNCHIGLKRNGTLAVNIAGVKSHPTLAEDFVSLAVANGWCLIETLQLALSKMPGTGKQSYAHKLEPVYVFRKSCS
jgi:hypothetical protein